MFNTLIQAARYANPLPERWRGWLGRSRWFTGLRELRRDLLSRMTATDVRDNEKMRRLYAYLLRAGSNCVDVGAHGGDFLRLFIELAPGGRHLAVEPLPEFSSLLRRDFPRVQIEQVALATLRHGGVHDRGKMRGMERFKAERLSVGDETRVIPVRVATLDSICRRTTSRTC